MTFVSESYPKHPDDSVIVNDFYPNGLTELHVWNYYNEHRNQIIREANYRPLLLFIRTESDDVVKRKMYDKPIILNNSNYDQIITPRTLALSVEMGQRIDYIIVDIDAGNKISEQDKKQVIQYLLNCSISKLTMVDGFRIVSTSSSYHFYFLLKNKMNVEPSMKLAISLLKMDVSCPYLVNTKMKTENQINLDFSPMYPRGSHQLPGALCRNGLMALDVTENWKTFNRKDARIK